MTPRQKYITGSVILGIAVLGLLIEILEMTDVIPKYVPTRELNILALIFIILASTLRRRARAEMAGKPQ